MTIQFTLFYGLILGLAAFDSPLIFAHGNSDIELPDSNMPQNTMQMKESVPSPSIHPISDTLELHEKILVATQPREVTASNSQTIRDRDLSLRMMTDPSDVIRVTPGLFTGQHAGGGKANQYFIRGYDADHGTDLALWFDNMPINMISHGHGQGFADMHFIIPELVEQVQVNKGTFNIEYGDLATAGSVSMSTKKSISESQVTAMGGMFNTSRLLTILAPKGNSKSIIAAEVYHSDGPFKNPEDMERFNLFLKTPVIQSANTSLDFTLMAYGSGWNGSGQIPVRAIQSGQVDRFGSLDPSEGGSSQRYSLSTNYFSMLTEKEEFKASAYLIDYRLSLFSDFTFFANDSVHGDEINQRDNRMVGGLNASYKIKGEFAGFPVASLFGIAARNDNIHTNLDNAENRQILGKKVDAEISEGSLSAFFQESWTPFPWLYLETGIRGDHFGFNVVDRLNDTGTASLTGTKDASIFSPKANIVITPITNWKAIDNLDLFLNYGEGFHSNDARGVTSQNDPARPLTKAIEYEVGMRTQLWHRWDIAASVWYIENGGEFVWVGDNGGTEEGLPAERKGVDLETRLQILPWLWADFDMTKCTAEFTQNAGNGNAVALAPRLTMAGGISLRHHSGIYGSLRAQSIDDRPADEKGNFTATGFTVVDMAIGYRIKHWEIFANIGNLFNAEHYTAQFENDSRIKNSSGVLEPTTVTDMHVVPGAETNIKGGVKVYF